jgi:DNA-binding CsgD family transcriptional regulator
MTNRAYTADVQPTMQISPREIQVLQAVAEGMQGKAIGLLLGIAANTVKNHGTSLRAKLGAVSNTHAVAIALRLHLIQ